MNLIDVLNRRYATKKFDPKRQIDADTVKQIKALLRMSPSSVNIQPWHFVIAQGDDAKLRVGDTLGERFAMNRNKVLDAGLVVVYCVRNAVDAQYMQQLLDQEANDGRFGDADDREQQHQKRMMFTDMHRYDGKDLQHWLEKQVYLNIGSLLLGAAVLGLDAVPMEGIDMKALDEAFDLRAKGYTAIAVVALGYRADDDFNADLPKSRLPASTVFTELDK